MFNSILIVCIGNICRSPIGERIFKQALPEKRISSAGIAALVGYPPDESAILIASENNISLVGHRARQLTRSLCHENDLILVMEKKHIEAICKISPESRGKIMLLGYWLDQLEINDPYQKKIEIFENTFHQIEAATHKWVTALKQ